MAKLKNLSFHEIDKVPDHVLEEMQNCAVEMGNLIHEFLNKHDSNIVMGAIGWVHASILNRIVSDKEGELEKAGKMAAFTLLKNIDILIESKKND